MQTKTRGPEIVAKRARLRTAAVLLLLPALVAAQDSTQDLPAERAADTYAVYRAALGGREVTYWIADRTMTESIVLKRVLDTHTSKPCVTPPQAESRAFREAVDDLRLQSQVAYRLEDRFRFRKAKVRIVGADEIERNRLHPYYLSSVGFSKDRSLALVIVHNFIQLAVAGGGWGGFEASSVLKRTSGGWEEQKWKNECRIFPP